MFFCFISCSSPSGGEPGDPPAFVPVTNISGVPGAAVKGTPLALTGTVEPANATNKTIAWTVINAGTTGADITGNTLTAANAGTVTVRATIANGQTASTPYTQNFSITVSNSFVPVSNISGVPNTGTAGTPLALTGTVEPANATNKTIAWTVTSAGSTGAVITGNTLEAANTGAVTVRASIAGGLTASTPYTQNFTVQIKAPGTFIPAYTRHSYSTVTDITFTPMVGTYTLDNILPYTNDPTGRNLQGFIIGKWYDLLCQMQVQADNLANGYSAVKDAYPNLTGINDIIANENDGANSIHGKIGDTNDVDAYLSGADASINAILSGIFTGTDRAQFDKLLDAYKKGNYAGQKVREDDDGTKAAAQEAFETALAETGLSFDELEPAMLTAINSAMGVDNIANASHRDVVSGLNGDLIKQIGDLAEAQALADDFSGLGYENKLTSGYTVSGYQEASGSENEYSQSGDAEPVPATD